MREERVECDTQALTAAGHAKGVKGNDKVRLCIAFQADSEDGKDGEDHAAYDFKGCGDGDVGEEEGFDAVDTIVVVAVEDVPIYRIYAHVIQHLIRVSKSVDDMFFTHRWDLLPTKYKGAISTKKPSLFCT